MPRTTKPVPIKEVIPEDDELYVTADPEIIARDRETRTAFYSEDCHVLLTCRGNPSAYLLYNYLNLHSWRVGRRSFHIPLDEICEELKMGRDRTRQARQFLEEKGLITIRKQQIKGRYRYTTTIENNLLKNNLLKFSRPLVISYGDYKKRVPELLAVPGNAISGGVKKKKSSRHQVQQHHINLAKRVMRIQKKNWPSFTTAIDKSSPEVGAVTLERLERIDGYSWEDIKSAILWALDDDFWSPNVITVTPLREKKKGSALHKFAKILLQYQRENGNNGNGNGRRKLRSPYPDLTRNIFEVCGMEADPDSLKRLLSNLSSVKRLYNDTIPDRVKQHDLWSLMLNSSNEKEEWTGLLYYYIRWIEGTPWARQRMSLSAFQPSSPIFQKFYARVKEEFRFS